MGQGFGVSLFFVYGLEAFLFGLFDSYVRTKNALVIIGFTDTYLLIPCASLSSWEVPRGRKAGRDFTCVYKSAGERRTMRIPGFLAYKTML